MLGLTLKCWCPVEQADVWAVFVVVYIMTSVSVLHQEIDKYSNWDLMSGVPLSDITVD